MNVNSDAIKPIVQDLSHLLADSYVLYIKTQNFHWNVTGPQFTVYHKFFEELYEGLKEAIDEIAERIRMLGSYAPGSLAEFQGLTRLAEVPASSFSALEMLQILLDDHRHIRINLIKAIEQTTRFNDFGTADFLTGRLRSHEKEIWMLESHLKCGCADGCGCKQCCGCKKQKN